MRVCLLMYVYNSDIHPSIPSVTLFSFFFLFFVDLLRVSSFFFLCCSFYCYGFWFCIYVLVCGSLLLDIITAVAVAVAAAFAAAAADYINC